MYVCGTNAFNPECDFMVSPQPVPFHSTDSMKVNPSAQTEE